ncbi:MAG: polysaccharide pyruvyl transferase CsaB [Firmicutes bacterium]|mgnify:CR=1 FL=1|nr:polysaccharide pyruvyl transferase CsaB [Bacillota bacterium]
MIVVLGYYGFGNLGDEAILSVLCRDLTEVGLNLQDVFVLSADPRGTAEKHGVQALDRYNFRDIWQALGSARCLISGGGSLLQDATSKRSLPYYLGLAELAFTRGVPVIIYGQGLGPISSKVYRRWTKRFFLKSLDFTIRDEDSAHLLHSLGVPGALEKVSADPVFQWADVEEEYAKSPRETLLLNIRPYPGWTAQRALWLRFIRQRQEEGLVVEFIPLGPGDLQLGHNLQSQIPSLLVHPALTLENYKQIFKRASLCVSMRLHGLIFSAIENVLPVGVNYDPKIRAVSKQLDILSWEINNLASLDQGVGISWQEYAGRLERCQRAATKLRRKAFLNRQMLARALGQE